MIETLETVGPNPTPTPTEQFVIRHGVVITYFHSRASGIVIIENGVEQSYGQFMKEKVSQHGAENVLEVDHYQHPDQTMILVPQRITKKLVAALWKQMEEPFIKERLKL